MLGVPDPVWPGSHSSLIPLLSLFSFITEGPALLLVTLLSRHHPPPALMGFHNQNYARTLIPNTQDPTAVDFRAFYPYHPNEVKHRKRTTSQQLKVLENLFKEDTKPNATLRTELAAQLNMTARGVQVCPGMCWFRYVEHLFSTRGVGVVPEPVCSLVFWLSVCWFLMAMCRRAKEKSKAGKTMGASKGHGHAHGLDHLKEEEDLNTPLIIKDEATPTEPLFADLQSDESQDAFSRSPSTSTSPPQLHVITDATNFSWHDSPADQPPDSASSSFAPSRPAMVSSRTVPPSAFHRGAGGPGTDPLYSLRRGSLPANAFPHPQSSSEIDVFDPLVRRRSVDASLQRLASNPYADLARAKNKALYGAGVGVVESGGIPHRVGPNGSIGPARHHSIGRLPYGYQQRRAPSAFPMQEHHDGMRRFSMDSRAGRFAPLSRMHQTPSPSPLTPYNAVVRASLPDSHLYSVTSRPLAPPIPGPLPSANFQFGAASSTPSMPSPSSGDSERNSPDSLRSFNFRGEEQDDDLTSPSYDAYSSRFGSIASIATSESSVTSAYYAELGGSAVEQADRRDSWLVGFPHLASLLPD